MEAATTTETPKPTTNDTRPHHKGALDRDTFCPQLQRLLLGAASELGQRGNLAQVVASIERGGVGGGGEDPNLGMLRRLGATDTRGIDNRVGQLRELDRRFTMLSRHQRALALAHYPGTPRAHHTLQSTFGHGQGGLAGVVLYRWQLKQAKGRGRSTGAGGSRLQAEVERVRNELGAIERELAECRAVLDAPAPEMPERDGPRPEAPELLLCMSRRYRRELSSAHWAAVRAWNAPVSAVVRKHAERRQDARERCYELEPLTRPLRDEQARLCAQLAALAAVGDVADDEQALVDLCRGKLDQAAKDAMLGAAADEVRALHRAWYATAKRAAKVWVDGEPAA
jgi:hypothetical protein